MVVIRRPATDRIGVTQDRTATPSSSTVQAPHCPSPHPYLLPVRSKSSRSTLSKLRSGSAATLVWYPLSFNSVMFGMNAPINDLGLVESPGSSGPAGRRVYAPAGPFSFCLFGGVRG